MPATQGCSGMYSRIMHDPLTTAVPQDAPASSRCALTVQRESRTTPLICVFAGFSTSVKVSTARQPASDGAFSILGACPSSLFAAGCFLLPLQPAVHLQVPTCMQASHLKFAFVPLACPVSSTCHDLGNILAEACKPATGRAWSEPDTLKAKGFRALAGPPGHIQHVPAKTAALSG